MVGSDTVDPIITEIVTTVKLHSLQLVWLLLCMLLHS